MKTKDVIKIWQNCHKASLENTSFLLLPNQDAEQCTLISKICSTRMSMSTLADELLLTISSQDDMPKELKKWLEVEKNLDEGKQGCSSCWVSSRLNKNHPECNEKINEYFESRKALENLCLD